MNRKDDDDEPRSHQQSASELSQRICRRISCVERSSSSRSKWVYFHRRKVLMFEWDYENYMFSTRTHQTIVNSHSYTVLGGGGISSEAFEGGSYDNTSPSPIGTFLFWRLYHE